MSTEVTNSANPPQTPQGLPSGEDQELKRLQDEAELNKVPPAPENTVGKDTTGVGQPSLQPVNQGQSLPQSAVPVDKKFEKDQFHDPMKTEAGIAEKDRANRGGEKADS